MYRDGKPHIMLSSANIPNWLKSSIQIEDTSVLSFSMKKRLSCTCKCSLETTIEMNISLTPIHPTIKHQLPSLDLWSFTSSTSPVSWSMQDPAMEGMNVLAWPKLRQLFCNSTRFKNKDPLFLVVTKVATFLLGNAGRIFSCISNMHKLAMCWEGFFGKLLEPSLFQHISLQK